MTSTISPPRDTSGEPALPSSGGRPRRRAGAPRFLAVLAIMAALFVYFSVTQPSFFTSGNLNNLVTSVSVLFFISLGLTFVMLSGGFDLSLGSMLALIGIMLGELYVGAGIPIGVSLVLCLATGAVLAGVLNGVLIGRYGLSFLVVTLGTLTLFRGALELWSNAETTSLTSPLLDGLAFNKLLGLPVPLWLMAGAFLIALYVLHRTYFGRDIYAVGGNQEAARLSGIRVSRTIVAVYAIAGLLAAAAGIMQAARVGASSPLVGEAIIFDAAAAVLIGGTTLAGGSGGVTGTMIGVLFLGVLQNGLSVSGVESAWQRFITGVILLFVVALDRYQRGHWQFRRAESERAGTDNGAEAAENSRAT